MLDDGTEKNFKMSQTKGKLSEFSKHLDRIIGKRQYALKSWVWPSQESSHRWSGTHRVEQACLELTEISVPLHPECQHQAQVHHVCQHFSAFTTALYTTRGFQLHSSKEAIYYKI